MQRVTRILVALLTVAALAGCARPNPTAASSSPTPTPTPTTPLVDARFVAADTPLLVGAAIERLQAPDAHVSASVPFVAKSVALSAGVDIVRNVMLRNFSYGEGTGLELNWQLIASSSQAVGVLLTAKQSAGAAKSDALAAVWYDPLAHQVFASPGLIAAGQWSAFSKLVEAAAADVPGLVAPHLAEALQQEAQPRGNGPALGFNQAGDMVAAFAGGTIVPGSEVTTLVIPSEQVVPLLSPFGSKARSAAKTPTPFDAGAAPKAPIQAPPATTAQPASPGITSGYPTMGGAAAVRATAAPSAYPLATTSAIPTVTPEPTPTPTLKPSAAASTKPPATSKPSAKSTTATPSPTVADDRPNIYVVPDCRKLKCVALTFDDGPSANETGQILRALVDGKAPATFFALGNSIEADPAMVLREAALGMEVGSHTWRHVSMRKQSEATNLTNLKKNLDAIEAITGERPLLMRPPYGDHSRAVNAQIASVNQSIVMWAVDTRDWESKNTEAVIGHALNDVRNGDIILMHDVQMATLPAVPTIITGLRNAGYTIVSVQELSQPGDWAPGTYHCAAPFLNKPCW